MTSTSVVDRPDRTFTASILAVLAALAYLPALASSPGRMPADSKLYLYLDPGRFLTTAEGSFDPGQFGGWVPHQHIAYLWPTGPFYWVFDRLGVPDWIAHRLWIGTLLFAAGSGIWWCVRRLDLGPGAAGVAAVVYQTSVYVLPYVSRTSVMLLPWAGLGWILGMTVRATLDPTTNRWGRWRQPALIALVVATIGAVNATALIMVAPAPVLWLATSLRTTGWRWTIGFAARTGVLCCGVSVWWAAMLIIQGRYGAAVLPYSETLADVSFTSTASEVWRGLGYWLFYIRDARGPATTSSLPYLVSSRTILTSYMVPLVGLVGLAVTRWRYARFAAWSIAVGGILAVGVHPIWDRSPLMALVGDGGLALALRSSTRALPVMMVGIALGCGVLVQAMPRVNGRLRPRVMVGGAIALVALINLPSLLGAALVDPALDRDQDPPSAWTQAAADLDADGAQSGRVLQVPGIEFGAYRWGVTVDQPVAGLSDKPLITRDLLPLGSAATMDVLYALDDRIQAGTVDSAGLAAASHVLGVDTVWLTGDLDYPRYQTARPSDIASEVEALGEVRSYGDLLTTPPDGATVDETAISRPLVPIAESTLVGLDSPSSIVRVDSSLVAVSGSGDGIIDSDAVHDIVDDAAVVYTADRSAPLAEVDGLVITDSNRNRDRHWRSSQDATGATLTATDPVSELERSQRLGVFETTDTATQTVAVHDGALQAYAATYGEPFGFQPEHRAVMAIDGSPSTAWTVGEHGDPVGASLVLTTSVAIDRLELRQYAPIEGQRRIADVTVTVTAHDNTSTTTTADLTTSDTIEISAPADSMIAITIDSVIGGEPFTEGIVADVGFTEVVAFAGDEPVTPTTEWIRTPVDAVEAMTTRPDLAVAVSLRRDRVESTNPWRSDPEPVLRRIVTVGSPQDLTITTTVRLNPFVPDRDLAQLLGLPAWASTVLRGSPRNGGYAAVDDDPATAWISGFGEGVGAELHLPAPNAPVDRLTITQPTGIGRITAIELTQGSETWPIDLDPQEPASATTVAVDPPLDAEAFTLRVVTTDDATTIDRRFGDVRTLPAGIAEIDYDRVPPADPLAGSATECVPIVDVDGTTLTGRVTPPSLTDLAETTAPTLAVSMCDTSIMLDPGEHRWQLASAAPGWLQLDAIDARNDAFVTLADRATSRPSVGTSAGSRFERSITIDGCADGCWLVFGEGFNPGWQATIDGRDLGPPTLIDGTSNGWWIDPAADSSGATDIPLTVSVRWTPQGGLRWAFLISALAVAASIALVVAARRRTPRYRAAASAPVTFRAASSLATPSSAPHPMRAALIAGGGALVAAFIVGGVAAMAWTIPVAFLVVATRQPRMLIFGAIGLVVLIAGAVIIVEQRTVLIPDAAWPDHFRTWHAVGMAAFASVGVFGVIATPSSTSQPG